MKRLITLCVFCTIIGLLLQPGGAAHAKTIAYKMPLAYIGEDGNVYVTSVGAGPGTRITNDAKMPDPLDRSASCESCPENDGGYRRYGSICWSPDGASFVFVERYSKQLYAVETGQAPRLLNPDIQAGSLLGNKAVAWSPDGKQVAYITGTPGQEHGLEVVSLADGAVQKITDEISLGIGDGPGYDDFAPYVYFAELGSYMFSDSVTLFWTQYGFLYSTGYSGIFLIDKAGRSIWKYGTEEDTSQGGKYYTFSDAIPTADGKTAVALRRWVTDQTTNAGMISLDLATGTLTPILSLSLDFNPSHYALMPGGKTILYPTTDSGGSIQGDPTSAIGKALFPDSWPFDGPSNAVSLWR